MNFGFLLILFFALFYSKKKYTFTFIIPETGYKLSGYILRCYKTRIGEKKNINMEKRKRERKKKREEKEGRKKRKRGKGKRKMKECRAVSRTGWRRTQNCATRGRFPPTPVHFTPRGCAGA